MSISVSALINLWHDYPLNLPHLIHKVSTIVNINPCVKYLNENWMHVWMLSNEMNMANVPDKVTTVK